jgi:hypothetical protein
MAVLPPPDKVTYLVSRAFPLIGSLSSTDADKIAGTLGLPPSKSKFEYAAAYERELRQLPPEEIDRLYALAKKDEARQMSVRAKHEEQQRFFNRPQAKADFEHWSRAHYWTLEEAVALTFGRSPSSLNAERLKPFERVSAFAGQYFRLLDLARRAKAVGKLYEHVLPGIYLGWAREMSIEVDPGLVAAVEARGVQIIDWPAHLKVQREAAERRIAKLEDEITLWKAIVSEEAVRTRKAIEEVSQLREAAARREGRSLSTRERESLLKLVIGMAVEGYRYDPGVQRSDRIPEIAEDLEKAGVALDVDTVRKYLKEASQLLPLLTEKDGR